MPTWNPVLVSDSVWEPIWYRQVFDSKTTVLLYVPELYTSVYDLYDIYDIYTNYRNIVNIAISAI